MRAREFFMVGVLCICIAIGSSVLTIWEMINVPSGTSYIFGHNNYTDYLFYLSEIQEGIRGTFFVATRYSTEQFPPQFAQPFFSLIGCIGGIFGLNSPVIYHTARIFGGALLLFLVYVLGRKLFKTHARALFGLVTVLFSVPMFFMQNGVPFQWWDAWTGFSPFYRITFLPHHIWSNIFGICTLLLIQISLSRQTFLWFVVSSVIMAASIVTNPAIALIYVLTLLVVIVLFGMTKKLLFRTMLFSFYFFSSIGIVYFFMERIYSSTFPWNQINTIERNLYVIDITSFLYVLGSMSIITFFSIITIRRWTYILLILTVWVCVPVAILALYPYMSSFMPLSRIRFTQSAFYIPVGLLAAFGMMRMIDAVRLTSKRIRWLVYGLICVIFLIPVPTFIAGIECQREEFQFNQTHQPGYYIPLDAVDILSWLKIHTLPDTVVLSAEPLNYMIPSFTHAIVPYGNPYTTYQYENKQVRGYEVFMYHVTPENKLFFEKERISYFIVYQLYPAPQEFLSAYNFSEVYRNATFIIYRRDLPK